MGKSTSAGASDAITLQGIGERLETARKGERLTQVALAKKLGVSAPTIGNWERAIKPPKNFIQAIDKIEKIIRPIRLALPLVDEAENNEISELGIWMQVERSKRGWTVHELAKKADVTVQTIKNIESGVSLNPQSSTRTRITDSLEAQVPTSVVSQLRKDQYAGMFKLSEFDPHSKREVLPKEAGVYVLYDRTGRPAYIGKAKSVRDRIRDHSQKFWFNKSLISSHANCVKISDKVLRHGVEQVLIRLMKSHISINNQSTASFDNED